MTDEAPAPADEDSGESLVANVFNSVVEGDGHRHGHEKAWWQSKKFIAFLLCELGFFVLMGAMIYEQEMDKLGENIAFMILAVTSGFGMVGYCLGQSYIDRYTRVAAIMVGKPLGAPKGEG